MDAEKEKRFRFQMQLEHERGSASRGPSSPQPESWTGNEDFDDTLRGAAAAVGGDKMYGLYKGLTDDVEGDNYDDAAAKEVRQNNSVAQARSPWLYGAGSMVPAIAAGVATGGGSSLLGAAAIAGGTGAVSGALESEAENIRDLGKDMAFGAAGGALGGAAGHGIAKVGGAAIDGLKRGFNSQGNRLIAKHVLDPTAYGKAVAKGEVQNLGNEVFEKGLTSPLSGRDEIARRGKDMLDQGLQAQQGILRNAPDVNINGLTKQVRQQVVNPAVRGGTGHSVDGVQKALNSVDEAGTNMFSGEQLNALKQNWQQAFKNTADGPSSKAMKHAAKLARSFEEGHVGQHLPGQLPEFMEAKGKIMIGAKVKDGMEYAAANPGHDLMNGVLATGGAFAVGGPGAAAATAGGAIVKHLADGREKTLLAHTMKALGQKDISKFRSAISKTLARNPMFLGKAGSKLQQAMMEDSNDPGSNQTARVAWEEQSNPDIQRVLKEERER